MSSPEKISCKLPLLDGDAKAFPSTIVADSAFDELGVLQKLFEADKATFHTHLFTAWALLLHCYTGQDQVCFRLESSAGDEVSVASPQRPSLIYLSLREDEALSECLERIRSTLKSGLTTLVAEKGSKPEPQLANTTIQIYNERLPVANEAFQVSEVSTTKAASSGSNRADFSFREKLSLQHAIRATS